MPQNKNILGERITDWEANQIGLPENSEVIWKKVELALETNSTKKLKFLPYHFGVAASIILLFVISIALFYNKENKTNQVVSSKKPLTTNRLLKNTTPAAKTKNIYSSSSTVLSKKVKLLDSSTNKLTDLNNEKVMLAKEALTSNEVVNTSPEVINSTTIPANKNNDIKPVIVFWKPAPAVSKNKFRFPIVHVNELNNSSTAPKNAIVQYTTDEKAIPNFEVPPPNEVKNKWKITLLPTTKPISLTDHQ